MSQFLFLTFLIINTTLAVSQNPGYAPLPPKLDNLDLLLKVDHFPSPVFASTDPDEPGTYFWKHITTVFSPSADIQIEEGGAYIFYNNQWNLRVRYTGEEISKLFNIPKTYMKAGEPYSFVQNWRRDSRLRGGWALWYIIGKTKDGSLVAGLGILDTVGQLY